MPEHMQIGEVADATGLSLRTIRHYEEVGLVPPTSRSKGGFRLYSEDDVERLRLVKEMKPLGFSLEQMCDLLAVLDALDADDGTTASREALLERLGTYRREADERVHALREQLARAESFARRLGSPSSSDERSGA